MSNCIFTDFNYDVIVGMPWHIENDPQIDYVNGSVMVHDSVITIDGERTGEDR